jgi:hypothetical protein
VGYSIQSIVALAGVFPSELPDALEVVELKSGVEMIPLGTIAREFHGIPFLPLTDEGDVELPSALTQLCTQLGMHGDFAYIEAEIFGGAGTQAFVWFDGGKAGSPVVANDAIKCALRLLGVRTGKEGDEFELVGLGRHRDTDSWLVKRTLPEARNAAIAYLPDGVSIIENAVREFAEGWVFYYQSTAFLATGNFADSLVGNAPVFVPRREEAPSTVGYHRSIEESMDAYASCGDCNAPARAEVRLIGCTSGALAVNAIRLIHAASSIGLGAAKAAVERCMNSQKVVVPARSVQAARDLINDLEKVGFEARLVYGAE